MYERFPSLSPFFYIISLKVNNDHGVKSVQIWSFFWSVFSCIWTRKNSIFGHFSRSGSVNKTVNYKKITNHQKAKEINGTMMNEIRFYL